MITQYATKRDRNGNRYFLILDHDAKTYTTSETGFFHADDYVEVSKEKRRQLLEEARAAHYMSANHVHDLAVRIVDTMDAYEIANTYENEAEAIEETKRDITGDPLVIIEYLLDLVEELQA